MDHFYSTSADGTLAVTDNYMPGDKQGKSLFISASPEPDVPEDPEAGGFHWRGHYDEVALSLSRDEAARLHQWLGRWLDGEKVG